MENVNDGGNNGAKAPGAGYPWGLFALFAIALLVGYVAANPSVIGQITGGSVASCGAGIVKSNVQAAQASQPAATSLNSGGPSTDSAVAGSGDANVQTVNMTVDAYGWNPKSFVVQKGVKVRWVIDGASLNGCNQEVIMPGFGIDERLQQGQNVVEFTPSNTGVYGFHCSMNMLKGNFIVVNDPNNRTEVAAATASAPAPTQSSGGCGCGMMRSGGSCGR